MDSGFEKEVLTRLTVIETKIDDYKILKEKVEEAYNLSKNNEENIRGILEQNKFIFRTVITAVITSVMGLIFIYIKLGLGV